MDRLRLDVWSDVACPWCWIGKRRLETALRSFPMREHVDVVWRSFELDPAAPRERDPEVPYAARLAEKYRTSRAEAESRLAEITRVAAAEGLELRFDRIRSGNTFDAHRLLHLAAEAGRQDAAKERFLRGYFTEGAPIGDPRTLARLAVEAGLDTADVQRVLDGDAFATAVRADEERAAALGVRGVPFFLFGERYGVSGAQPAETLLRALQRVWQEGTRSSPE